MPIEFVKAKEVYDPNSFINSLVANAKDKREAVVVARADNDDEDNVSIVEVVQESVSIPDDDDEEDEIEEVEPETILVQDAEKDIPMVEEDASIEVEENISPNNGEDVVIMSVDEDNIIEQDDNEEESSMEELDQDDIEQAVVDKLAQIQEQLDDMDLIMKKPEAADESDAVQAYSDAESDGSDFDENDLSALSFLLQRDMDGGGDMVIDASPPPETDPWDSIHNPDSTIDLEDMVDSLAALQGGSRKKRIQAAAALEGFAEEMEPGFHQRKKKRAPSFSNVDPLLREDLIRQSESARQGQALKKQEREELRKEGKLKKQYKETGYIPLHDKYPDKLPIFVAVTEMQMLLDDDDRETLTFPAMSKNARGVLHELAKCYFLQTSVSGVRKGRHVVCHKNQHSSFEQRDKDMISFIINRHASKPLKVHGKATLHEITATGANKPSKLPAIAPGGGKQAARKATRTWREGELVGHGADEIDESNIGRAMLEKIGWTQGMSLGPTNTGISQPIFARVKISKHGLGS